MEKAARFLGVKPSDFMRSITEEGVNQAFKLMDEKNKAQ